MAFLLKRQASYAASARRVAAEPFYARVIE